MQLATRRVRDVPVFLLGDRRLERRLAFGAVVVINLVFHWNNLATGGTTLQWDAIDYHLGVQSYFSQEIRAGRLPFWTEFVFSGYPFLADPQVGAWYPPNWPFFLAGIAAAALKWQFALHTLLASLGTFFLALQWITNPLLAAAAGISFGLSGFFAGHSSHVGMFQAAAWLPWILLCVHRAVAGRSDRAAVAAGIAGACMFLAGHFQTSLYTFAALALYAAGLAFLHKDVRLRAATVVVVVSAMTVLLSAVQLLPTYELVGESTRATRVYTEVTNAPLEVRALGTLITPNLYGSVSGRYTGPQDITQFYFYGGVLLLPLAAVGCALHAGLRVVALLLAVPTVWYAFGPEAGLYRVIAALPGFGNVRAPVNAWFVVALSLALLSAAGAEEAIRRLRATPLVAVVLLVTAMDLVWWNSWQNQVTYARKSYETLYGKKAAGAAADIRRVTPAGTRFHGPGSSTAFGPMNVSLQERLEVTFGYNPLELRRYNGYYAAIEGNGALTLGLNAGAKWKSGYMQALVEPLPRFYFARSVKTVASPEDSRGMLPTTDPAAVTIVEGSPPAGVSRGGSVTATSAEQGRYVLQYDSPQPALLRAAIPWFPGWRATLGERELPLRVVDHALTGIEVPAGSGQIVLEYGSTYFAAGAGLSLLSLVASLAALLRKR